MVNHLDPMTTFTTTITATNLTTLSLTSEIIHQRQNEQNMVIYHAPLHYCLIFYLKFFKHLLWNPLQILKPNTLKTGNLVYYYKHTISVQNNWRRLLTSPVLLNVMAFAIILKYTLHHCQIFKKTITILRSDKTWNNDTKANDTCSRNRHHKIDARIWSVCHTIWHVSGVKFFLAPVSGAQ